MLEGLEASELKIQNLEVGLRIDAETYQKNYVRYENYIKEKGYTTLKEEASIVKKGIFDIKSSVYADKGIPFVRISNLKNMLIDTSEIVYIPIIENEKNLDTFLDKGDVILSKTAIPAASIVSILNCNTSQDTVAIKLKNNSLLIGEYLVAFLNTPTGMKQMQRRFTGNIQMHLNLTDCKENLLIPIASRKFQLQIKRCFDDSIKLLELSISQYSQAQALLLEELKLKDWHPSTENNNEISFSESFLSTGRLDAEYYQPKYKELLQHLKQFETKRLGLVVDIKKSIEPGSEAYQEEGIPFIRVANVSKFGITSTDIHLDRKEYQTYELKPKKDTILLSKDGSVGIAYKVEKDLDVITSGALLHLNIVNKEYLPDYLTLVLNSIVVKLQAERDAGGSIIQHWKPSEIEQVIIPKLSKEIQQQIADKVQESFKLKQQSEHLLEAAKYTVELAIEQNEAAAVDYINKNTKAYGAQ